MKSSIWILIGIVAVLIVGGAFAFAFMDNIADVADDGDCGTFHKIANKVDEVSSSDSSSESSYSGSGSDSGSDSGSGNDILSEVTKFNGQEDGGSFREVTYKDGGFRQYDTSTGDLIGSSYDEDQEQLGVTDGNLE